MTDHIRPRDNETQREDNWQGSYLDAFDMLPDDTTLIHLEADDGADMIQHDDHIDHVHDGYCYECQEWLPDVGDTDLARIPPPEIVEIDVDLLDNGEMA